MNDYDKVYVILCCCNIKIKHHVNKGVEKNALFERIHLFDCLSADDEVMKRAMEE
jgi:hypothetical protein